jgi:L-fuconolactonase
MLARAGIGSTVLVQAAPTLDETRFLLGLGRDHAFIAGVVGWVDFEGEFAAQTVAALSEDPKLVGLRPMIQDIADDLWMLKPALAPAIETMIDHDLVFDALVLPRHLPALREFADLYPELRLVVDHGAKPPLRGGDLAPWKRDVATIARETRAVCKLSGLVTEAGSANPAALAECVDHLVECFGPARLLWGSDWPVCELVCSYEEWYQASEMLLVRLSESDRQQIYAETAREIYGI